MSLSHLDESGRSSMVDVGEKETTRRVAVATGRVRFPADVYAAIQQSHGQTAKGTITEVARLAGIMAAKNTAQMIPLCHPMMLERCKLDFEYRDEDHSLAIRAEVAVSHKTGVEMEALSAVSVAALTVYDMTKALSHDIRITDIELSHKSGGKHEFNR
ncbi:MAG: cyclic pyranopterin monophosphate synthase MoaC [Neisseria sp.]|uniref:cyclic pyranopterin monophosphate synthase MoaC n=1 Tax=Neisseria sp. TaxID=192066 RepID=UPI0026DBDC8D|nr:cyclic pyranopterin monophosphate synthase MoaC [Neisseria sp.]MDO4248112.1 cyclic pyranopterin monophosphate synthase MoaC [Neisseria sp.]